MVSCANAPCQKKMRLFDPLHKKINLDPAWMCDLCGSGKGPYIAKEKKK